MNNQTDISDYDLICSGFLEKLDVINSSELFSIVEEMYQNSSGQSSSSFSATLHQIGINLSLDAICTSGRGILYDDLDLRTLGLFLYEKSKACGGDILYANNKNWNTIWWMVQDHVNNLKDILYASYKQHMVTLNFITKNFNLELANQSVKNEVFSQIRSYEEHVKIKKFNEFLYK